MKPCKQYVCRAFLVFARGNGGFRGPGYGSEITGNWKENIRFGNSKCLWKCSCILGLLEGSIIVEFPHFVFIALNVGAGNVGVNLVHGFVIAPTADLHGDFGQDAKVRGEGGEAVAKLMDGDALDTGTRTGALDGASQGVLMNAVERFCPHFCVQTIQKRFNWGFAVRQTVKVNIK